jgi:hypothetical protein
MLAYGMGNPGSILCVLQRNSRVSTPNITARKSGEGPLPYCKIGADSEVSIDKVPLLVPQYYYATVSFLVWGKSFVSLAGYWNKSCKQLIIILL